MPSGATSAMLPANAVAWLWAPAQVSTIAATRDLPDGGRQVIDGDGNKLRDHVEEASHDAVVLRSELQPRNKDVPGRKLRYELSVTPGAGTAVATLGLSFADREAPTATVDLRRWRRHLDGCLARLADACEVQLEAE